MLAEIISRVRRNHGLEHATIHVLTEKHQHFSAQGNSGPRGFQLNVFGDISEAEVETAVREAYTRMKNGESELAVHPNCGTVLLTMATLATLAAQGVFGIEERRQGPAGNRASVLVSGLPAAVLAVVASFIVSRPLGIHIQANYTTAGDLGNLEVASVRRVPPTPITRVFQLLLTGGNPQMEAASYRITTRERS